MKINLRMLAVAAVVLLLAATGIVVGGFVPIAADKPHMKGTGWFLHSSYERALKREARAVLVPAGHDSEQAVVAGAISFDQMCSQCHTPPGLEPTPVSMGINPAAPELIQLKGHLSAAEIFWVIKHGVRMTGMPAFGKSHSDEELWPLVALVEQASGADAAAWQDLLNNAEVGAHAESDGHNHRHSGSSAGARDEPVVARVAPLPRPQDTTSHGLSKAKTKAHESDVVSSKGTAQSHEIHTHEH